MKFGETPHSFSRTLNLRSTVLASPTTQGKMGRKRMSSSSTMPSSEADCGTKSPKPTVEICMSAEYRLTM